ncbi:histone-like nucleoid-structuring protein Lsr2 [Pseudonocardia phyllosphaerae]|uniref:histone-like nucleoid-structuring protein Lsr2 n=1 Tax=Pseudonocardia phyllosphaerae TaxID=3390502 RepID=UPI00397A1143
MWLALTDGTRTGVTGLLATAAGSPVTEPVDDLDGGRADVVVDFALDGTWYRIRLSSGNADRLRTSLAPYVDAGRHRPDRPGPGSPRTADRLRDHNLEVRRWARVRGYVVSSRGRLPDAVVRAYYAGEGPRESG